MTEGAGQGRAKGSGRRGARRGFRARLRTYFLTGLIVAAPIAITVYITYWFVLFVDETVARLLPAKLNPSTYLPFTLPGLGLAMALLALTLIGFLTTNYLGRSVLRLWDSAFEQMPVVRSVYSALKQLFEAVFGHGGTSFRQVCLVEYPRTGTWAIAFVTTEQTGEVGRRLGGDMIGLFVPTTPNPTSGYLIYVRREEVRVLDMSVEDAMKLVVSGGVVRVEDAGPSPAEGPAAADGPAEGQPARNSRAAASRSNR